MNPQEGKGWQEGSEGEFERITERLRKFSEDRDWGRYHTPRNLAVSVAIETGELLEHFQWKDDEELAEHLERQGTLVESEIADVLIYALNLAMSLGIDPAKAINDKITNNELRFPAPGVARPVGGA